VGKDLAQEQVDMVVEEFSFAPPFGTKEKECIASVATNSIKWISSCPASLDPVGKGWVNERTSHATIESLLVTNIFHKLHKRKRI